MSKPSPVKVPADARELLQFVNLTDVRYFEVSARRAESGPDRPSEPQSTLELMQQQDESNLITRFRMRVTTSDADLLADLAVRYVLSEPVEMTQAVVAEFIEKVAAMTAYPYLRESISTSAVRLGVNVPTLGLMKQGDFRVSLLAADVQDDDADDQAE